MNARARAAASGRRWLAAGALGILCLLQLLCLMRAGPAWMPATIAIALKPGAALVLGQHELAAPQADAAHLALRRDTSGRWRVSNASTSRQLLLQYGALERRTGSTPLHAGVQFEVGSARFRVDAASQGMVVFTGAGQQWTYDGATLARDGAAQAPCPDARLAARAAAAWNRWFPRALTFARPLSFGGNLYCGNRLGITGVPPASAMLARGTGGLLLSSAGGASRAPVTLPAGVINLDLAHQEEELAGVTALTVGHSRFLVAIDGDGLRLRPSSHVALFAEPQLALPPQVTWRWQRRDPWHAPGVLAWPMALGLAIATLVAGMLAWRGSVTRRGAGLAPFAYAAAGALLAVAGGAALLLQRAGDPPGVGLSLLLAWSALWYGLLAPGRLRMVTAAGLLLLAVGLLAQLELGLGAMESSWLRHFQKTAALLAVGVGLGALCRAWQARAPIPQARLEWMLLLLAAGALAGLLLQVAFGDETGVFDLQPVEFAKLALTALAAHCIAIGLGANTAQAGPGGMLLRWLRLGAPVLLLVVLLGVALVQVDDYSPLILLLVWGMGMALAYALAARRHLAVLALLALACMAAAGVAGIRYAGTDQVARWSFYADRFLVWLEPASHPHTGQQLLLGARAVADGGWWGVDRMLGVSTLGTGNGAALHIPAVQDDFAPSFFLNRHGLLAALALWMLQALFLVALLSTAARAWQASLQAGDFRDALRGRFHCFALCGGAAFVLGHFMLSWGTNLAIFPIMGQPMSFLSAGGSHLLLFICPLLALAAVSAQSFEESQPCRSMSNTK